MSLKAAPDEDHTQKITIQNYPGIQRIVADILHLSRDLDIQDQDMQRIQKKLQALKDSIRKCLRTPEGVHAISDIFNSAMVEIQSREKVRKIYNISPIDLSVFASLPLVSQMIYLIAENRDAQMPGAICHHWTIFWYNFWNECKKGTLFENVPIILCQRTSNKPEIGYGQHTFLLLELEKRYVLSADGKIGISMREATNFSQVGSDVFRTVKEPAGFGLESIRTFKSTKTFAKKLDAIPTKFLDIAVIMNGGVANQDQSLSA